MPLPLYWAGIPPPGDLVDITETFHAPSRQVWRKWLRDHHATAREIWLILKKNDSDVTYLEAVEEALCFGWIDGIAKKLPGGGLAQRFTPRRPRSHWTELNKERARRLIRAKHMTAAGRAVLPSLDTGDFSVPPDILAALQADPQTWAHFQAFDAPYQRVRIGYIEEVRRQPDVFQTRLNHFLRKTRDNKRFGGLQ